jgi:hypothetical protein
MDELEPTVRALKGRKAEIEARLASVETPRAVAAHPPRRRLTGCWASGSRGAGARRH